MAPALLTAVDSTSHIHLIIGSNPLAGARCTRSIEVGAKPLLVAPEDANLHYGLTKRIDEGEVQWLKRDFRDEDLTSLGRDEVDNVVDAVFVTLGGKHPLSTHISTLCRKLRIPVNVADAPNLCTFTLLSTHSDGPLQIGVTTSGKGCKLSARIRREIAASLPPHMGEAVERLGTIRRRIWEEDQHAAELSMELEADEDDAGQPATFNKLVTPEDAEAARTRRMRWLAQICEYWPLRRLAAISDADVDAVLRCYTAPTAIPSSSTSATSATSTTSTSTSSSSGSNDDEPPLSPTALDARTPRRGLIVLAGAGPGHPDLLTLATHKAIQTADLILADKLVPAPILALTPRRTVLHIARKFPGNAERAQRELLELGRAALRAGQRVVRLKQGDPFVFGRGGEEVDWFRCQGWEPLVLPGVTSALAAPLFAGVPVTQRAVAEQVLVCTGTGRGGERPRVAACVEGRTVVLLMALHCLREVVGGLVAEGAWPRATPCVVVERASCADQRVVRSSLEFVCAAVEEVGSRPPGLLVVGRACEVLAGAGDKKWVVEEGFRGFEELGGDGGLGLLEKLEVAGEGS